jgi:hypothetical protein
MQFSLCENLWLRGTIGWVDTSKMVIYSDDGVPGIYVPEIKPKSSTVFSLGAFFIY